MDLSFIIVEYNCLGKLRDCLKSILQKTRKIDCEIIVSSNSCYDKTEQAKSVSRFPEVRWFFNKRNLGYAKAVNVGLMNSMCKYSLIVNPDIELMDGNVHSALEYFENNPDIGIIGPQIVNGECEIQDSCRTFITPYMFASRCIKRFVRKIDHAILDGRDLNILGDVDWVSGACMLVKREAVEKVGFMDERYFMYIEDMDWCKRFWDSGFRVVYWPHMKVRHDLSRESSVALTKGRPNRLMLTHFVSYLKFFWKYFPKSCYFRKVR